MLNLIIGVAIGAAFSKFWIALWEMAKEKIKQLTSKEDSEIK